MHSSQEVSGSKPGEPLERCPVCFSDWHWIEQVVEPEYAFHFLFLCLQWSLVGKVPKSVLKEHLKLMTNTDPLTLAYTGKGDTIRVYNTLWVTPYGSSQNQCNILPK